MNKQELIDYCKTLKEDKNRFINCIDVDRIINTIKQLDESPKVTIPKFVADYIEFKKKHNFHVYGAMRVIEDHYDKRVPEWFYEGNVEKFCLAWILGYEVEKEKRYRIKLKNNSKEIDYLVNTERNELRFYSTIYTQSREHTRKELEEAGFSWIFDCPGIEIEEVK